MEAYNSLVLFPYPSTLMKNGKRYESQTGMLQMIFKVGGQLRDIWNLGLSGMFQGWKYDT